MKHELVLTNEDHSNHAITLTILNAALPDDAEPEQGEDTVVLPDGTDVDDWAVTCVECGVRLLPDEDFDVREVEPWKA